MSHQGPWMNEEQKLLIRMFVRAKSEFHAYSHNIAKCMNYPAYAVVDLPWVKPTMSASVLVQKEGFMQAMRGVWDQEFLSLLLEMEET